jgi:hypothetical protein
LLTQPFGRNLAGWPLLGAFNSCWCSTFASVDWIPAMVSGFPGTSQPTRHATPGGVGAPWFGVGMVDEDQCIARPSAQACAAVYTRYRACLRLFALRAAFPDPE